MRDIMRVLLRQYKLSIALVILFASIFLALAGNTAYAQWLITGYGLIVAAELCIGMIRELFHGRYGVDILAVVAIVSTAWVGEYWATIVIVLMMLGGEALETYANARARAELAALLERAPTIAHKQMVDGSTRDVPLESIRINDIIVVRAGEMIPVDGVIGMGESQIDTSSLTGESAPVDVAVGDEIMSGAVNGAAPLVIRATQTAAHSQYAQIVTLVKHASEVRAPFVRMADRYAVPFTAISFAFAGLAWWVSGEPRRFAEVLVVATPCPLLIAAPVAMISGMSRAAKHGIIVKNGAVLEKLATVRAAAFDKTGTLTTGQLSIDSILPAKGISEHELMQLLVTLEQHSGHVTADALRAYAETHGITPNTLLNSQEIAGGGVVATTGHRRVIAGKRSFLVKHGVPSASIPEYAGMLTYLARSKTYLGCVTYADTIRPDARQTVRALRALGLSRFVMLTGDKQEPADTIARQLDLSDVRAECLPKDKLTAIKQFPVHPIMMVGDGVNDAPVLAASDVGVAMGARGASAASESADAVIMVDNISKVVSAITISRRSISIARQSVMFGIVVSVLLMIIATFGLLPALLGAILQEVIDVIVILNALRAHRDNPREMV